MSSFSIIFTLAFLSCLCNLVSADIGQYVGGSVGGLVGLVSISKFLKKIKTFFLRLY
jgi:hypothetical protein